MEYRDQTIEKQDVLLDGNTFTGCTFRNCRMIFKGMHPVMLGANHFTENVKWQFDGPAALTVQFMTALYHGAGEGGRNIIEKTFENIRRGG